MTLVNFVNFSFLSFFQETWELQLLIIVFTTFQLALQYSAHSSRAYLLLVFPHFFPLLCNRALPLSAWQELPAAVEGWVSPWKTCVSLARDMLFLINWLWEFSCTFWLARLGVVLGLVFFWFVCTFSPSHAQVRATALVIYYAPWNV